LRVLMVVVNDMQCTGKGIHDMCPFICKEVCNAHQGGESSISKCYAHLFVFSGLIIMCMSVLCQKPPLFLWHAKRCLESECLECGVTIFKVCPRELQSNRLIEWKVLGMRLLGKQMRGNRRKPRNWNTNWHYQNLCFTNMFQDGKICNSKSV
jgi:hypothetical protein